MFKALHLSVCVIQTIIIERKECQALKRDMLVSQPNYKPE